MSTFKQKYNKKLKLPLDTSHTIKDISKQINVPERILQEVYNRGYKAADTNWQSVRQQGTFKKSKKGFKNRLSNEQWAWGRLMGFVMTNPKQVKEGAPDRDLYEEAWKHKRST